MREEYYSRSYVSIFLDREQNLGGAVWRGFMTSEEFREAITACINLIEESKPAFWLADNRGLKAIRQADQTWMHNEIVPVLGKSSIRKMASLVPADFFGQLAVENMATKASDVIQHENAYFKHEPNALRWLLTDVPYTNIVDSSFQDMPNVRSI